ncbi:MAG: hypothetical protein M0Q93_05855 [Terrimicrobiaceae bacterium]|nr:hypothetical protein [Terrimicrobiaceae bacterium]
MKTKLLCMLILAALTAGMAASEYVDSFSGLSGPLDGQPTAEGFGNWVVVAGPGGSSDEVVVRDGAIGTASAEATYTALFSLPDINLNRKMGAVVCR